MKTIACPLNFKSIDGNVMRANTFIYFLLASAFFLTHNILFILAIYIDIAWMFFHDFNTAPFYTFNKKLLKGLGISESRTDSGPKKFAWGMALTMMSILIIAHFNDCVMISSIISMKIIVFTLAETMINFCMGCFIYKLLVQSTLIRAV